MKINSKYEKKMTFSILMENVQEVPDINFVIETGRFNYRSKYTKIV